MSSQGQALAQATERQSSGPQGTQLFSTDQLRRYASDAAFDSEGRASIREPVLEGISAGLEGRRFSLRAGRQTVGRRGDNDVVIDDPSVSASHAWLMNQQGHYVIMNTLSTNGTFVNDQRIHEAILKHGDHVRLGHAEFVFMTRERGTRGRARLPKIAAGLAALSAIGVLVWWLV